MKPFKYINEAVQSIEVFAGDASEFELPISDSLLDPIGINMAMITDKILAKGWEPDGHVDKEGYRIHRYKQSDQ